MAPFWHLLFPPAEDLTASARTVNATAESQSCDSSNNEEGLAARRIPEISTARSDVLDAHGCCKMGTASTEASCCRDTPAEDKAPGAGQQARSEEPEGQQETPVASPFTGKILYGSQKGTAAFFAHQLARAAASAGLALTVADVAQYEVEQMWKEQCIVLVLSTYEDGAPPSSARCAPVAPSPDLDMAQSSMLVPLANLLHVQEDHCCIRSK